MKSEVFCGQSWKQSVRETGEQHDNFFVCVCLRNFFNIRFTKFSQRRECFIQNERVVCHAWTISLLFQLSTWLTSVIVCRRETLIITQTAGPRSVVLCYHLHLSQHLLFVFILSYFVQFMITDKKFFVYNMCF